MDQGTGRLRKSYVGFHSWPQGDVSRRHAIWNGSRGQGHEADDGQWVLFYQKILPNDNLPKLYVRRGIDGAERMLLDLEKLGTDKAHMDISYVTPSWDGKYIAVALAQGGSEMATLHVYEVATMRETGPAIDRIAGDPPSIAWLPDRDAFYYTRLQKLAADAPATELYQKARVYLHWVGEDPAEDSDVFGWGVNAQIEINPLLVPVPMTSPTGHYVVTQMVTTNGGAVQVYVAPIQKDGVFAAVLDLVPMSDMLRSELTANGGNNVSEYGSVKTKEGFRGLYAMSPYVHVKEGVRYPAVLLTTGINDPRVEPWQPAKMAARLQAANGGARPILFRVDYDAGHGLASTRKQMFEEMTDWWTFLLWQMGEADFQPTAVKPVSPSSP